jgi:hypothetical protein
VFHKPALCQGTISQAAEKRIQDCKKRQGTTSQAAEKCFQGCKKRQGTTSQAAEKLDEESGSVRARL